MLKTHARSWMRANSMPKNRSPCTISAPQTMALYTFAGSQSYTLNTLEISLQAGWYGVGKTSGNNDQAWRQYVCGGGVCHP